MCGHVLPPKAWGPAAACYDYRVCRTHVHATHTRPRETVSGHQDALRNPTPRSTHSYHAVPGSMPHIDTRFGYDFSPTPHVEWFVTLHISVISTNRSAKRSGRDPRHAEIARGGAWAATTREPSGRPPDREWSEYLRSMYRCPTKRRFQHPGAARVRTEPPRFHVRGGRCHGARPSEG